MLSTAFIERAIAWAHAHEPGELARSRAEFEQRTAPIETTQRDYEARISHFFEQHLCTRTSGAEDSPLERFASGQSPMDDAFAAQMLGFQRSERALLEVTSIATGQARVRDLLRGARYRVALRSEDRALTVGERFDGRLVPVLDTVFLSPGRIYHPREAHGPLDIVLDEARRRGRTDHAMLDALLRMRARFLAFESIRAEHVYRFDAIDEPSFAAPWARHTRKHEPPPEGEGPRPKDR